MEASLYSQDNISSESLVSYANPLREASKDSLIIREAPTFIEDSEQDILLDASLHLKKSNTHCDEFLQHKNNSGENNNLLYLTSKESSQDLCIDKLFPEKADESTNKKTDTPYRTPYISQNTTPYTSPKSMSELIDDFPLPHLDDSLTTQSSLLEEPKAFTSTPKSSFTSPALSSSSENAAYESAMEEEMLLEDDCSKRKTSTFSGIKNRLKKMYTYKPKAKEEAAFENLELKESNSNPHREEARSSKTIENHSILSSSENGFLLNQAGEKSTLETPNYNRFAKYKDDSKEVSATPKAESDTECLDEFTARLLDGFDVDIPSF
ncbi:hypothetical protein BY458DRAFT_553313 [Sporodiniella umbellata]|nr:hypothetical protein BY458DRAFT_553313 [Sporodiniella umbellata]